MLFSTRVKNSQNSYYFVFKGWWYYYHEPLYSDDVTCNCTPLSLAGVLLAWNALIICFIYLMLMWMLQRQ